MDSFSVTFSFKGETNVVHNVSHQVTKAQILSLARQQCGVSDDVILKLLYKGKIIGHDSVTDGAKDSDEPVFTEDRVAIPKSGAKVIVIGTVAQGVQNLNSGRSDPLIRGFDDIVLKSSQSHSFWGVNFDKQHSQYKFCRMQECAYASFGSRPGTTTPHSFEAKRLLERLSTDPGIISILKSRKLVVGTLGEMDPIDDRLMQKKQQEGACLLGYNTNHGLRIDIKLRTDDLSSFRPYNELAATLIHELSHNWVGDHNILFWTNFGQMRVEYLWTHACLLLGGLFVNGKRTAELAGVSNMILGDTRGQNIQSSKLLNKALLMENIFESVIKELSQEMMQHHIPTELVAPAISQFVKDILLESNDDIETHNTSGQRLGTSSDQNPSEVSYRELALAAAEKRAKEYKDKAHDKLMEK